MKGKEFDLNIELLKIEEKNMPSKEQTGKMEHSANKNRDDERNPLH